ncbi:MAG TPA: DUF72 domain-containing protein, partial [Stellaceae bacterium]|nr:DUF72 domain-containing protein [Stellaceae bacterium]
FYPEKMPAREHFVFYAKHFNTVELNNSFYRQPPRERFEAWREQAPTGFVFAVKGSRYVTHLKRLVVEKTSIDLVVDTALGLGDKLGPILFQLQANFHLDLERLEHFVAMLPRDVRFTVEFRHDSWLVPSVLDLLRAHRIALCIPDHPKMPHSLEITSDFTYIRMHMPPRGLGYGRRALEPWAHRIIEWRRGTLDVFVYFNNDMEGHAIKDAQTLMELIAAKVDEA